MDLNLHEVLRQNTDPTVFRGCIRLSVEKYSDTLFAFRMQTTDGQVHLYTMINGVLTRDIDIVHGVAPRAVSHGETECTFPDVRGAIEQQLCTEIRSTMATEVNAGLP